MLSNDPISKDYTKWKLWSICDTYIVVSTNVSHTTMFAAWRIIADWALHITIHIT